MGGRHGLVFKHVCKPPIRQACPQCRCYAFRKSLSQWTIGGQRPSGDKDGHTRCVRIIEPAARSGLG